MKLKIIAVLLSAVFALALRLLAAGALPLDYDEPTYLNGAQAYAHAMRTGNWAALREDASPEHPQLMKLYFGAAALVVPEAPPVLILPNVAAPPELLRVVRMAAAVGGVAHVATLALVDPLAGLLLAVHSGHAKYTSLVMLEALPGLTALLCLAAWRRSRGRWGSWLAVSAVMLGLTAAGKYLYCVVAIAIVIDALLELPRTSLRAAVGRLTPLLPWGIAALAVFFAASPYLWSDPIVRLRDSVLFHAQNASAVERVVNTEKFVWWQPLGWIGAAVARNDAALPLRLDALIAVGAAAGIPALWKRRRVYALWLAFGLVFLLIYPNKWPQYALIVSTPLCMAASEALRWLGRAVWRASRPAVLRLSRGVAAALVCGAAAGFGVAQLADDPYNADPAFREATRLAQARMAPDEMALAIFADPAARAAVLEPGWRSWNAVPAVALGARNGMLSYDGAAALLNRAAGRHGVWLLTYQRTFGDPAETVDMLLQRQSAVNGPSEVHEFPRGYALVHYRFGAGYEPLPTPAPRTEFDIDPTVGAAGSLRSEGCAQLRTTPVGVEGGTLEVTCFWRSVPYETLPWDTRVRLALRDSAGRTVAQGEPLIARSGFPWFHYEDEITGVYLLTLPPGTAPGRYELRMQPASDGVEQGPAVRVAVQLGQ